MVDFPGGGLEAGAEVSGASHRGLDLAPPDGNDVTNVFKTNSKNPVDSPNVICTVYLSFCSALACSVCNSPPARRKIGMVKQRFIIRLPQITLGTEFCQASTSILDTFITDVAVRMQEVIFFVADSVNQRK